MSLLSRVVIVVLLQSATGNYCSLSDTKIHCVPCEGCISGGPICYVCPKQCGKLNNCYNVCAPNCRYGNCEYLESDSVPLCTRGCNQGFTGKQCEEYCSEGCKECDQKSGNCTSCVEGFKGENCNQAIISSTSAALSPSAIMRECETECDFCNDTVCEKCTDATKCQLPCGCFGLQMTTDPTQFPQTSTSAKDSLNTHPQTTPQFTPPPPTESTLFWYKISIAVTAAVAAVLVICIALICYRKRFKYREMKRNNQQLSEMEQISSPAGIAGMDSDSDPYACIEVFDRDCVPEHLFQAAMVTAPQIVTSRSSLFN